MISTNTSGIFGPEAPTLAISGGTPTIITWDTVAPGGTEANNVFLVVHNYYSPSAPNGEKVLLDKLAVGPSESSMAD